MRDFIVQLAAIIIVGQFLGGVLSAVWKEIFIKKTEPTQIEKKFNFHNDMRHWASTEIFQHLNKEHSDADKSKKRIKSAVFTPDTH